MPQLYESFWSWTWSNEKLIMWSYSDNIKTIIGTGMGVAKVWTKKPWQILDNSATAWS